MDMKEKLVELTQLLFDAWADAEEICSAVSCENCYARPKNEKCMTELAAAYLLSHGATVQEWISTTDKGRKPPSGKILATNGNSTIITRGAWLFRTTSGEIKCPANFGGGMIVTHWMPLPDPPCERSAYK